MLLYLALSAAFLHISYCQVTLEGYETSVVLNSQSSTTVTCKITSNVAVDSSKIKWVVGSINVETLDINDSNVSWDSGTNLTKLTVETVPKVTTSNYRCQYSDAAANNAVASIVVIGFEVSPASTHIIKDSTGTLTCTLPTTQYSVSVQWYRDDQLLGPTGNAVTSNQQVSASGSYKCVAIYTAAGNFAGGSLTSSIAQVSVLEFVSVSEDVTLLQGQVSTVSCTIPSAPYSVKVNWYSATDNSLLEKDQSDHANAQYTGTYQVTSGGGYYCKAIYTESGEFSGGELRSSTITVTLIDFTTSPTTSDVGRGNSHTLNCKLGLAAFTGTWSWFKDNAEIAGTKDTILANQENVIAYKVDGSAGSAGEYFCRAVYDVQVGLQAGSIDSSRAIVTIPDVTVYNVVVEKAGTALLHCDVSGAAQDPQVIKFTYDGVDLTEVESLGDFNNGVKKMTVSIANVEADKTYTCVVGWNSNTYSYNLNLDMIEVKTEGEVNAVSSQSSTLTCQVTDSNSTPHSVYWIAGGSTNIMAETAEYLPQQTTSSTTLTSTLQIKSVSGAGTYTCVFVYQSNGAELMVTASTQLKVIFIEVGRGGALQYQPGISTVSCKLTQAETQPNDVYWKYNSVKRTQNVTLTGFVNGEQSTELRYWGVDSDSNFFCYWVWGSLEIKQPVPVEVGELSVTGLVVKQGDTGRVTCSIKDFESRPDKVTWYKDGTKISSIIIGTDNAETSWTHSIANSAPSDAGRYTCDLTVGNDNLQRNHYVVVGDPLLLQPPLTAQGGSLTLTCQLTITNLQSDPTAYWTHDGSNITSSKPGVTQVTSSVALSTLTLENVNKNNELLYGCVFVFEKPEFDKIYSNTVTPDILVFTEEPTSQYGKVGETASFTCVGESGNSAVGIPTVDWYNKEGTTKILAANTVYSIKIPEGGTDVICKVTWEKTNIVLSKRVSAIVSNIDVLKTQYTTVGNSSVTMTCLYHATSVLGDAPTEVVWYRTESDASLTNVSSITGFTVDKGIHKGGEQKSSLTISNVKIGFDSNVYQCHFTVGGQTIIGSTTLRVIGIHLNVPTESQTVQSGKKLSLTVYTSRTYDIAPSWRWFRESIQTVALSNDNTLVFEPIRVGDAATYVVNAHFEVPVDGVVKTLDVPVSTAISVTASCRTGTIRNIKNSGNIPEFVDDGWTAEIHCLDDYLLDDNTYNRYQNVSCKSTDFVQLEIVSCTASCILKVTSDDTQVTWHGKVLKTGIYHMYSDDTFTTSCDGEGNRTLPSGTNPLYTCQRGGGLISYTQCTDGCAFIKDDKIEVTLPDNLYNPSLIPVGEKIKYECLKGEDNIYNTDQTFTCTTSIVDSAHHINLQICSMPVPWEGIIIAVAVLLLLVAIVMLIFGAYLYLKRQKRKIKLMNGGDGIYSNPAAKESDGNDMEMVELCKPIPILQYHAKYRQLMVDDCYALSLEYAKIAKDVPSSMFPITVAKQPMYKSKNRFIDILPYDATRVTLQPIGDDPTSHYINASYIDTLDEPRKFIAAQGPKPETLSDFWRMIWELNSHVIVMVTNCVEKGRRKCEEYWSDTKPQSYGNTSVQCLGIVSFPDYKVRKFSVTQGSAKSRIITHYHYEGWPDHGVPDTPTSMIAFAKRAFSDNFPGPITVHCSAGVGRTGTIISLHMQMENIRKNNPINIYDTVIQLRKCRKIMVQTESQYVFVYQAVNEILRCGDTEIYAQMLSHAYRELRKVVPGSERSGLQTEYQRLVYIAKEDINDKFVEATKEHNHNKNRYHNILPYERNRVKLLYQTGVPGSDYINASYMASYHEKNIYISTQAPKDGTVVDFWKMIQETRASSIVCMTNLVEDGKIKCAQYWPSEEHETVEYGACKIKLLAVEEGPDVTRREMCLTHASDGHQALHLLRMWHFTTLSEKTLKLSGLKMISAIEKMSRWQKQQGNTPSVVHCGGGVGRAAAYIAIANCLEQLKLEGTVDIFQTVLQLRRARPFMVQSVDQYDYIYRSLLQYVDSFDTYENFK